MPSHTAAERKKNKLTPAEKKAILARSKKRREAALAASNKRRAAALAASNKRRRKK